MARRGGPRALILATLTPALAANMVAYAWAGGLAWLKKNGGRCGQQISAMDLGSVTAPVVPLDPGHRNIRTLRELQAERRAEKLAAAGVQLAPPVDLADPNHGITSLHELCGRGHIETALLLIRLTLLRPPLPPVPPQWLDCRPAWRTSRLRLFCRGPIW
jgi:hypothetical protein